MAFNETSTKGNTMLSQDNIDKINDLIDDELHTANGAFTSHKDKMEAIERVATLKALLTPQPSRTDILRELATALTEAKRTPASQSPSDLIADILSTFRR
jgi:hypothetical protein